MLSLEREARAAGRGIWSDPFYAMRSAETAGEWLGGFELVEGRVVAVGRGGGRAYLNFGEDWRPDFTVAVDRTAQKLFQAQGLALDRLPGKRLRVRGWRQSVYGPLHEATPLGRETSRRKAGD